MSIAPQFIGKTISFDEKIFVMVKANNGNTSCISLQNVNSNLFLRHRNGKLIETDSEDNSDFFPDDSSFIPEIRENGIALRCSNVGLEKFYICKIEINNYVINKDLIEFIFKPLKIDGDYSGIILGHFININNYHYLIVPANNHESKHISLLNSENGMFLRHCNGKVLEDACNVHLDHMNVETYNNDSSFYPEASPEGIILHCVNEGLNDIAIVESDTGLILGKSTHATSFPMIGKGDIMEMLKIIIVNTGRIKSLLETKKSFFKFFH